MMFSNVVVPVVIVIVAANALVVSKAAFVLAGIIGLKIMSVKDDKPAHKIILQEKKGEKLSGKYTTNEGTPLKADGWVKSNSFQHYPEPYKYSSSHVMENSNFLDSSDPYSFHKVQKIKKY